MSCIQGRGVKYKSTADRCHSSCAEAPLYAYAIHMRELVGCFIMSSQAADPDDHGKDALRGSYFRLARTKLITRYTISKIFSNYFSSRQNRPQTDNKYHFAINNRP